MTEAAHPHDLLFHAVFEAPEHALGLLASTLPAEVMAVIDPTSLELQNATFVDPELRKLESDLLFRARLSGREAWLYLLLEHQSAPDAWMSYRLLRYVVRIWERSLEGKKRDASLRLPAVVPVVLFQGPRPWSAPRSLAELIDLPAPVLATVERHVPRLELLLDDLGAVPRAAIEARRASVLARLTLLFMKAALDGSDFLELIERATPLIEELMRLPNGEERLALLVSYTHRVREIEPRTLRERLARAVGPVASEVVMSTAEKLIKQGIAEGMRTLLLTQLEARFGPMSDSVRDRVMRASATELDRWGKQFATAGSIEAVFA